MRNILTVLALTVIMTGILLVASAQSLPGSGFYQFRRVYEKILLKAHMGPKEKVRYYTYLLDERMNEVAYVYRDKSSYGKLSSSLRYSTTVGEAAQLIHRYGLEEEGKTLLRTLERHKKQITEIRDSYHYLERKYLEDDINYIDIYSSELSSL